MGHSDTRPKLVKGLDQTTVNTRQMIISGKELPNLIEVLRDTATVGRVLPRAASQCLHLDVQSACHVEQARHPTARPPSPFSLRQPRLRTSPQPSQRSLAKPTPPTVGGNPFAERATNHAS